MRRLATNAQEEALQEIATQLRIRNTLKLLRDQYESGVISSNTYAEKLEKLLKVI
jgi:hypothetical protein